MELRKISGTEYKTVEIEKTVEVFSVAIKNKWEVDLFNVKVGDFLLVHDIANDPYNKVLSKHTVKKILYNEDSSIETDFFQNVCHWVGIEYDDFSTAQEAIDSIGLQTMYDSFQDRFFESVNVEEFEQLLLASSIELRIVGLQFVLENAIVVQGSNCFIIS